jgi:hypothetical protein
MDGDDLRTEEIAWLAVPPAAAGPTADPPDYGEGVGHGHRYGDGDGEDLRPPRLRGRYLILAVVVGAVFVVGAIQNIRRATSGSPQATPTMQSPGPTPRTSSSRPSPVTATSTSPAPVQITSLNHALLPVPADWSLFVRAQSEVVRIDLARGRVTRTATPPSDLSSPDTFVFGRDRVLVHPSQPGVGYLVVDDRPAVTLADPSINYGLVFPGPGRGQLWSGNPDGDELTLVDFNGHALGPKMSVQPGWAVADGTGYVLFSDVGGVYEARPRRIRRVSPGELLAAGPTRLLVNECDSAHRCLRVAINRATGTRQVLGPRTEGYGVISPDGDTAAMIDPGASGTPSVTLLDLTSGRRRQLPITIEPNSFGGNLVWSPDSRWLFTTDAQWHLLAADRSGHVHTLPVRLTAAGSLGLRTAN